MWKLCRLEERACKCSLTTKPHLEGWSWSHGRLTRGSAMSHLQNDREMTSGLWISESKSLHAKLIFLEGESIFITKAVFNIVK